MPYRVEPEPSSLPDDVDNPPWVAIEKFLMEIEREGWTLVDIRQAGGGLETMYVFFAPAPKLGGKKSYPKLASIPESE